MLYIVVHLPYLSVTSLLSTKRVNISQPLKITFLFFPERKFAVLFEIELSPVSLDFSFGLSLIQMKGQTDFFLSKKITALIVVWTVCLYSLKRRSAAADNILILFNFSEKMKACYFMWIV